MISNDRNEWAMFDQQQVSRVLRLHEKSYALLRWVKASLRTGRLSFAIVHGASDSSAAAAREWIGRHLANIPDDARPEQVDVPTFARLFVSFLTTSFQLTTSSVKRVSDCGCYCEFCSYLRAGPGLDVRTPTKKHVATALELKRIYLARLASELTPQPPQALFEAVLGRSDLREQLAVATWGAEMLRRSEFSSQGEPVLALWANLPGITVSQNVTSGSPPERSATPSGESARNSRRPEEMNRSRRRKCDDVRETCGHQKLTFPHFRPSSLSL